MLPLIKYIWRAAPNDHVPDHPKKILLVRVGALGDVIMTTPTLETIQKKYPNSQIDFACGEWSAPILKNNPVISNLHSFPDRWVFERKLFDIKRFAQQLKSNNYDMGFFFDKSWHWSIFASWTNITYRIGFNRTGEGFGYHKRVPYTANTKEYIANLDLAAALGCTPPQNISYSLYPSKEDKASAKQYLKEHKLQSFIGIAPGGANNPGHIFHEKRWPQNRYKELITLLSQKHTILLFGGKEDKQLCDTIATQIPRVKSSAGELNALASVSLMSHTKLFITHDSGAMHMASASGAPLLALFGPTSPQRFSPPKATVIYPYQGQTPCYDANGSMMHCKHNGACMQAISVEEVYAKTQELL